MHICTPPKENGVWNTAAKLEGHLAHGNGKVLYCTDARHVAYPGSFSPGLYAAPLPGA